MVPDRIEREIVIDAPVEVVWAVVTEPGHVGKWFGDSATIDLRPGGEATLTWDEHGTARARVERVDPPHSFAFRWARPAGAEPGKGNSTLVEFTLRPEGEGTRLRVIETGFGELDLSEEEKTTYLGENEQGWDEELGDLREYVTSLGGSAVGG
jgi:uncharacterized protein YndB with AHSA1/START domain